MLNHKLVVVVAEASIIISESGPKLSAITVYNSDDLAELGEYGIVLAPV